jgi:RimJ/RimL family protein N-acetyltransferase
MTTDPLAAQSDAAGHRLNTSRLLLRPLSSQDAPSMAHLLEKDSAAVRMTERISDPCNEAAALEWIARRQGPGERTFAIDLNGTFIGCIGLSLNGRNAGLGYWLGRSHWNCGYATEAGQAIVVLARGIGLTTIIAEAFLTNPASAAVLTKLGFAGCGPVQKLLPDRGGLRTLQRFELQLCAPNDDGAQPRTIDH